MGSSVGQLTKRAVKNAVDQVTSAIGVEVRIRRHDWNDVASFIPFDATLQAARAAGLSVGDYIDGVMNKIPGSSQATVDQAAALGAFSERTRNVVEIGPGSGRYLEKVLKRCAPERYEIYETAPQWADYVARTYGVVRCATDGRTLAATASESVDLIQAYKVFSSISFLPTARYWAEIARVARPGGYAVFDIVTEACMDAATVARWAASDLQTGSYPALIPRAVAIDCFAESGFQLAGSFLVPMGLGTTETFVFKRIGTARQALRAAA